MRSARRATLAVAMLLLLPVPSSSARADETSAAVLDVGVKEAPPFVLRGDDGVWSGLAIDLWEEIARRRGVEFRYLPHDLESLLAAVESGEVDVAVGALSMTFDREARFDFTHSYFVSGLGIAARAERSSGWTGVLERLFSRGFLQVVGLLALVLLVCGLLVWLFERKRNPEMFGGPPVTGVGSGFWWAAVTMTTVGYGDKAPMTPAGRVVALVWMFTSLIVISGFTAAIASALTLGALESEIDGTGDLPGVTVASVAGSSSADWLDDRGIDHRATKRVEDAVDLLADDRVQAVVYDAPILEYLVRKRPDDGLVVLDDRFELHPYAFAVPSGSDLLEPINREILAVTTSEEWRRQVKRATGAP